MTKTITSIYIESDLLDWIKEHRIIFSDYIKRKIFEDMEKERSRNINPENKLEEIQQKKFQLEQQEKFLMEQQQVKASELQAIEQQEKARKLERAAHQFLAEDIYNSIAKGATLAETSNMIADFIVKNQHLSAFVSAEIIPDLDTWYRRQLKIIEAAKISGEHTL